MLSDLFVSTVVRVKFAPFNHRIMKSLWQKGQFPTLSASALACYTNRHYATMRTHTLWFAITGVKTTQVNVFLKWDTGELALALVLRPAQSFLLSLLCAVITNHWSIQMEGWGRFTPWLNKYLKSILWLCDIIFVPLQPVIIESQLWHFVRAGHRFPNWTGLFSVSAVLHKLTHS